MGGEDHAEALSGEAAHFAQDAALVAEVEAGGGFVEEDQGGFLGEGAGDQGELAFAAGDAVQGLVGEVRDAHAGEAGIGHFAVVARRG